MLLYIGCSKPACKCAVPAQACRRSLLALLLPTSPLYGYTAGLLQCCTVLLQVYRCVTNVASDFYSGVQAALIHRTGSPAWVPASLKDVSGAVPPQAYRLCRRPLAIATALAPLLGSQAGAGGVLSFLPLPACAAGCCRCGRRMCRLSSSRCRRSTSCSWRKHRRRRGRVGSPDCELAGSGWLAGRPPTIHVH